MKALPAILAAAFFCSLSLSTQAQNLDSALARLRSDSASERVAALRQLAKMPAEYRAVEPMMNVLRDSSPDVRQEAFKTWAQVGTSYDEAVKKVHRWQKHRSKEQNDAEHNLWREWQKQVLDSMVACTEDGEDSEGNEAVRTLAKLGSPAFSQPGYCAGTSAEMLDFANRALSRMIQVVERQPSRLLLLEKEKDIQVASALGYAIAFVDYPSITPILRGFLKRNGSEWRLIGVSGLRWQKGGQQDLLPLLSDADNRVREQAVIGITSEGRERLLMRLIPTFHQSSVPLRRSIVQLKRV